ncbi:TetR/AcrR family transcriptional regulator [Hamadaea tsunoensis]|uniref:TetR/AcrR family transcriptional regulator n=1 Tax=Hamadaea tsunoensis TaxID=53368 RepID=UPI00042A4B33|nr:TetR/AcrR family transcriptional regulator [Hamadaea tsunoensis]
MYHHGNLRREILEAALAATEESGPANWSLRELSRRAGVSHTAPVHHFGDKTGLLTAIAAEGFALFADELEAVVDDFFEVGVAYIRFAVSHRAYFEVMFRPELYRTEDPEVVAARERARQILLAGSRGLAPTPQQQRAVTLAAWSTAHGFASLWLSGALTESADGDAETVGRQALEAALGHLRRG